MKIVDANVLINSVNTSSDHHGVAKGWLEAALSGGATVGLPWAVLTAFVRISTSQRLFERPLTGARAMALVDGWVGARSARIVSPGASHADHLRRCLTVAEHPGALTSDAHLAALALEHRATIVSFDSDFGRFPGVRWEWPA